MNGLYSLNVNTIKRNWRERIKDMKRIQIIACVTVLFVMGCAGGGGVSDTGPRKQRNLIKQDEIGAKDFRNTYEVIQALRPQMLRVRGSIGLAVFVNGIKMSNGTQSLYDISPSSVGEIRYLNSFDATARFGTDAPDGAISITTK
tara:strand:- start:335 stop:769 length:435 start_codon:yes stop_codon:yes gene_type:complete